MRLGYCHARRCLLLSTLALVLALGVGCTSEPRVIAEPAVAAPEPVAEAPATSPAVESPRERAAGAMALRISQFELDATPLREGLAQLERHVGLQFHVQWDALAAVGVTPDMPVTLKLRDVRASKVLRLLFDFARRDAPSVVLTLDDGRVVVTTS